MIALRTPMALLRANRTDNRRAAALPTELRLGGQEPRREAAKAPALLTVPADSAPVDRAAVMTLVE